MDRVRKTYFNPLATSKAQVRTLLEGLPKGSAHPYSPEQILLCRTDDGIEEVDISSYPEDFFFNAVDLGEMGEILLKRMACFREHLQVFEDFQITQATSSTFEVPIINGQITILAVSYLSPTYYDFCFGNANRDTCCWCERTTFPGMTHSGDILRNDPESGQRNLLDYVTFDKASLTDEDICVFISGYQVTPITRFLGTHPALLVADHVDKILYIIPVPLDAATIGDATLCCPMVIRRRGDSLVCSILPTATTEGGMMCSSNKTETPMFAEGIKRADFTIRVPEKATEQAHEEEQIAGVNKAEQDGLLKATAKDNLVLTTNAATLPRSFLAMEKTQVVEFGTGIDFKLTDRVKPKKDSSVVLPCVFGSQLEGPLLLATGRTPSNVPFLQDTALISYYQDRKSVVMVVDERMTDNARNLASYLRINAVFVVQMSSLTKADQKTDVLSLLNLANINAVTALAGPQSLVLVEIFGKYYFYRGMANRAHVNTSKMAFGTEVTSIVTSLGFEALLDPRVKRIVNLDEPQTIMLPSTGQLLKPEDLAPLFEELPVEKVNAMDEDIAAAVPQLQALLNQKDLQQFSQSLVAAVSAKVGRRTTPLREAYTKFLAGEFDASDNESVKKKNAMLGELRKTTKELQKSLEPAISQLANMMSSQTTSKRTHDLKRLVRQTKISGNVEAAKSMTFDTLAGLLEEHAGDMGVMLLNIDAVPYGELLGKLTTGNIDASSCCSLDSRMVHLDGLSAGIIMEQSQTSHHGPLRNRGGPSKPTLALPHLSHGDSSSGSMLAWVCWDEFVDLENPYSVRWMERCNDPHIAAARILMRSTLSQAVVASREHTFDPGSPATGDLMSALLMAAMAKLAASRSAPPPVALKQEDTSTRLMRGLFGNLLTTAGSGVRPMSMVWQLFGQDPKWEVPAVRKDWIWYKAVVALFPYTGWDGTQLRHNLERLVDRMIVRMVTKNEKVNLIKMNRLEAMVRFCKLRNVQLEHSRTVITVLMRMLTAGYSNVRAVASRLLQHLPHELERQTESYRSLIAYLKHLSEGGERRIRDDCIAASVYVKRSAAFASLKDRAADACAERDAEAIKRRSQAVLNMQAETAQLWGVPAEKLRVHNLQGYRDMVDNELNFEEGADAAAKEKTRKMVGRVIGDAERKRVPWRVKVRGSAEEVEEPLDEAFLEEMLTGTSPATAAAAVVVPVEDKGKALQPQTQVVDPFEKFKSTTRTDFLDNVRKEDITPREVCQMLDVPTTVMRQFAKALNEDFAWEEELGRNFRAVVLGMLEDRSGREESRPARKLLGMGAKRLLASGT